MHRTYVATDDQQQESSATEPTTERTLTFDTELDDDALIRKAKAAKNGKKFTALWEGQTTGYPSQSEADMALCCLLAFWTDGDTARMDSLFRESGLIRKKWDRIHYADGATYGERTIERACELVESAPDYP